MDEVTEEWARTAPAGPELDEVVAVHMGYSWEWKAAYMSMVWVLDGSVDAVGNCPPRFSTDSDASKKIMDATGWKCDPAHPDGKTNRWKCGPLTGYGVDTFAYGPTQPLARARAYAVDYARWISREDLG